MSDAYVVGDPDGLSPLLVELRDAVARELHAQLAMRGERIELADLPEVSYQVTIQVERAVAGLATHPVDAGRSLTESVTGPHRVARISPARRTSAGR